MTNVELIKRLTAMKICTECQIKGKPCDDDCKWQYEAGNMGEIVQTLDETIKALEQETVSKEAYDHEYFLRKEFELKIDKLQRQFDKIRAEIQENINYNKKMNYQGIVAGLLLTLNIINKYRKVEE